jgi:hypothetical protein
MALIKCGECGQQMSSSAKVCPHCGKPRPSAGKTGCAWVIVLVGAIFIWSIWNADNQPSTPTPTQKPVAAITQTTTPSPKPIVQPDASLQTPWIYRTSSDSMTGKPIRNAYAVSRNTVDFSFPYAGAQHAMLTLRKHPRYGTDVIFSIERGQFGCGFDGCPILVRFNDGKAESFTGNESEDHSTTTVFISPASRFIAHLQKAKVVRVESSFYQEGRQVFTFNVSGFDDKQFDGK